jgi:hypothetical protein
MQTTRRLISGELVRIDVPDAVGLPDATSLGVLALEGLGQLEVTGGGDRSLAVYLELTGTILDRELTLGDGRVLRYGRFGGDPTQGFGWGLEAGPGSRQHVYGFTYPFMELELLASYLADVQVQADDHGPWLELSGRVGWSVHRTETIAQVVELEGTLGADASGGLGYLIDARRARAAGHGFDTERPGGGVRVRGGLLSRSAAQERHRYVVLESDDFVSYGMPGGDGAVEVVASSMADVLVELGR